MNYDFNKVRIIGVTQPVVDDIPNSEGILSFAARVSNPKNQDNFETAAGLLKYCVRNKHFSVFETCNITMEIETPRDIARQILRHRSFSFQEFSQRYAIAQNFCIREARKQDYNNRQNSVLMDWRNSKSDLKIMNEWEERQREVLSIIREHYDWAEMNLAKEVARVLLPEGLTMSKMYMNGTVRSWMHFVNVRDDEGVTQREHVDVARKAKVEILKYFPFLEEVMSKEN